MTQKVAIIIWRRVKLGSLNRLLNPVLIITYIEILLTITPEKQLIINHNGTGVSPSKKVKTDIKHHRKYASKAIRARLILTI
jgi:hypothetical protein